MITCIVFFGMLTDQGLRICCEALFWEIYIAPFPIQKVHCFQEYSTGCVETLLPLRFQGVFGVLPRICISEVPWWRPAEMSFFFLWKINHLWWSFHFLCLFRWRIMELFDGNVESPKKGPVESLTWNSHFIPFLVPKKVPEQNRLSFDETGSGSSELFFVTKRSQWRSSYIPQRVCFNLRVVTVV